MLSTDLIASENIGSCTHTKSNDRLQSEEETD